MIDFLKNIDHLLRNIPQMFYPTLYHTILYKLSLHSLADNHSKIPFLKPVKHSNKKSKIFQKYLLIIKIHFSLLKTISITCVFNIIFYYKSQVKYLKKEAFTK